MLEQIVSHMPPYKHILYVFPSNSLGKRAIAKNTSLKNRQCHMCCDFQVGKEWREKLVIR